MKKMTKFMTLVSAMAVMVGMMQPVTSHAAEEISINISEDIIKLNPGETSVVEVDYTGFLMGAGELMVVSSDRNIVAASLADTGNGQACLAVAGNGTGTATVAVYSVSNAAIVDYVVVQSGMADAGEIVNVVDSTKFTTIYNDRIIYYNNILTGKNGAQMAITSLVLEREHGIDCLKVSGELMAHDVKVPGMNTFYADYYDAAGGLISRQAVYTRDPQANTHMELKWYIPDGCVRVDLE